MLEGLKRSHDVPIQLMLACSSSELNGSRSMVKTGRSKLGGLGSDEVNKYHEEPHAPRQFWLSVKWEKLLSSMSIWTYEMQDGKQDGCLSLM